MASHVSGAGKGIVAKIVERMADLLTSKAREDRLVEEIAEERLAKFAVICAPLFEILEKEETELKKIDRPDQISYDRDKKPTREDYSKTRLDQIDKVKEKINKIEKALTKAIEHGDINDAQQLAQQFASKNKGGGEGKDKDKSDPSAD